MSHTFVSIFYAVVSRFDYAVKNTQQVLDKNTVKLVASEFDLLVIDKEEVSVTDAAKKSREFLELDDLDHAVSVMALGTKCEKGGKRVRRAGGSWTTWTTW